MDYSLQHKYIHDEKYLIKVDSENSRSNEEESEVADGEISNCAESRISGASNANQGGLVIGEYGVTNSNETVKITSEVSQA